MPSPSSSLDETAAIGFRKFYIDICGERMLVETVLYDADLKDLT